MSRSYEARVARSGAIDPAQLALFTALQLAAEEGPVKGILPLHGNTAFNLEAMLHTNILQSEYFQEIWCVRPHTRGGVRGRGGGTGRNGRVCMRGGICVPPRGCPTLGPLRTPSLSNTGN